MVFRRSEYGLQYKKSHLIKNIPEYYNHVAYRTHRRDLEHAHTPLSWDFESDDITEEVPIQKLQIKEEDIKESEGLIQKAKDKLQKYDSQENQNTADDKQVINKVNDNFTFNEEDNNKGDNTDQIKDGIKGGNNDDRDSLPQDQLKSKEDRVPDKDVPKLNLNDDKKKTKLKKKKSPIRPKSSPSYKPPFMAYGCGDLERETGVKRSFNVRASADVYPAAMKALVDLHEKQRKRENAKRCLSARERKRKALVQEKAAKEVAGWQSEYRRMYPVYKPDEYARSASRIQEKPHAFKPYVF